MACPPHMMTLKSSLLISSSKPHEYGNYDKAPFMFPSTLIPSKANLFTRLFTYHLDPTTSPSAHQQASFKVYFLQESDP